ncbi:abortive infection family protein [Flavobacterium lacisediminis]|uniref:Abortive infection family protein n=1 Tax=Flavobacterium lacisediminis TaxID=2989705 RepID=A0ABT3EM10_9FLAO|nr:abortive infection family protein [Flavobacterium lacisediminis]MCW1149144.1 abortive infection family protein [Flavobacterium lacisediminis]
MNDELKHIDSLNDFELAQYFQDHLIMRATGDNFDKDTFAKCRLKLLDNKSISHLLPKWLNNNRTIDQFWTFIKARYSTYQERREFIWSEFNDLLSHLETGNISPLNEIIVFDEIHIHELWQKAIERKGSDPEGAITAARTLIESVLKHILDDQSIIYNDGADLPVLYKEVAKSLNLAPELHNEGIFKQILGGVNSVVTGLGALRNKLGDAHGKGKTNIKPSIRHSELAVNLAGSMAIFLFKSYSEKKNIL